MSNQTTPANPTTLNRIFSRIRSAIVIKSATDTAVSVPSRTSRHARARRAISVAVFALVVANVAFAQAMDHGWKHLRDPEYGRRLLNYVAHKSADPARPMVTVFGSSRVAMGVRPDVANRLADKANSPRLFNFGQTGAGPLMQLMTLRRMLDDGVVPDAVMIEFWPPMLYGEGIFAEDVRIDPHRLFATDRQFVRDYFANPERVEGIITQVRRRPWFEHRGRFMSIVAPKWLPQERRLDSAWDKLDRWGWLPGYSRDATPTENADRHKHAKSHYDAVFKNYQVSKASDRALREMLGLCQQHNVPVSLLWLPETIEFQTWYTPAALTLTNEYLAALRTEFALPLIDARDWATRPQLADGFHLSQQGAAEFSERLAVAVQLIYDNQVSP